MTKYKIITTVSLVLFLLMCVPCMAACPYTISGNSGNSCSQSGCDSTKAFTVQDGSTNYFGNFAQVGQESCEISENENENESKNCSSYNEIYDALRQDNTEKTVYDSKTYNSRDFATDIAAAMQEQGISCQIVKVNFINGNWHYINSFDTCNGTLFVDSCGTTAGTGIKKVVNTLEPGERMSSTSLFKECTKTYTRGIVASIEYLD